MKRCPKCGTVLDDDKKKCYMCGADLLRSSITQFGDSFDPQIGATVSNNQDNVFNGVTNIQTDFSDAVGKSEPDSSTFTNVGADFYNNGLDGLNSMQYDNRTAIEKIFSGNQRFKSKDEINAELAISKKGSSASKKEQKKAAINDLGNFLDQANNMQSNGNNLSNTMSNIGDLSNTSNMNPMGDMNPMSGLSPFDNSMSNTGVNNINNTSEVPFFNNAENGYNPMGNTESEEDVSFTGVLGVKKPDLMPGFELPTLQNKPPLMQNTNNIPLLDNPPVEMNNDNDNNTSKFSFADRFKNSNGGNVLDKVKGFKIDIGFIINTVCFIVFLIIIFFVYNKFISPKAKGISEFGGLYYKVNSDFTLTEDDRSSRTYKYGNDCMLQIKFGTATGSNSSVDDYFESVKENYSSEEGFFTKKSTLDIQGNKWSSLDVLQIEKNEMAGTGATTRVKYRYVSMIYNGNYYHIQYANKLDDNRCTALYDETINSMEFKQKDN